jgi:hypothetical protein
LRCVIPREAGFTLEPGFTPGLDAAEAGLMPAPDAADGAEAGFTPVLDAAEALSESDLVAMTILSTLTVYWLVAGLSIIFTR